MVTDTRLAASGRTPAALVRDAAPEVRLRLRHNTPHIVHRAPEYLRTVDGMLPAQGLLADVPAIELYEDRRVCVVDRFGHPGPGTDAGISPGKPYGVCPGALGSSPVDDISTVTDIRAVFRQGAWWHWRRPRATPAWPPRSGRPTPSASRCPT